MVCPSTVAQRPPPARKETRRPRAWSIIRSAIVRASTLTPRHDARRCSRPGAITRREVRRLHRGTLAHTVFVSSTRSACTHPWDPSTLRGPATHRIAGVREAMARRRCRAGACLRRRHDALRHGERHRSPSVTEAPQVCRDGARIPHTHTRNHTPFCCFSAPSTPSDVRLRAHAADSGHTHMMPPGTHGLTLELRRTAGSTMPRGASSLFPTTCSRTCSSPPLSSPHPYSGRSGKVAHGHVGHHDEDPGAS